MAPPSDTDALRLEPAREADLPAVTALMNLAYRGGGPVQGWCSEAGYVDGERTSPEQLAADLRERPDAAILLHREGDAPAASVWLEPLGDGVWYLGGLSIDPRLQNGGLGRRMLDAAEAWAAGRGGRTMRLTVVNVRDTLIAWYVRRGYALTGETEPWPYGDDRFGRPQRDDLSFVVMQKPLG